MTEKPLKYQAYALIRQKIINCEYAPGAFITENLLQETVPGSRTPSEDWNMRTWSQSFRKRVF